MKTVLLAPKSMDWVTPENAAIGSHVGTAADTYREIAPSSGETSIAGNVEWNTRFPAGLVESTPRLRSRITFRLTGLTAGDLNARLTQISDKLGVSDFPVNRYLQTGTVDINGYQTTTQIAATLDAKIANMDPMDLALITQASLPDAYEVFDSNMLQDPLKTGANAVDAVKTRGLGAQYLVSYADTAVNTELDVTVTLEEMITSDSFQWQTPRDAQPFKDINSFILTLNIQNMINALNINQSVAGVAATVVSARHSLLVRTWAPSLVEKIPGSLVYNSPRTTQIARQSTLVPVAGSTFNLNTTTINGIPSMFVLMVRRPRAAYGTVRYCPITGVSVDMDNRQAIFQNMNQYQLYSLSSKNGYNRRFATFAGQRAFPQTANNGAGSILFFRPSDMGLQEGTMSNANKTLNVGVQVSIAGASADETCSVEMYAVYDNFIVDKDGSFSDFAPRVSPEKLLSSPIQYAVEDNTLHRVLGGSFWTDLWNVGNRGYRWISQPAVRAAIRSVRNLPGISQYAGDATTIGSIAHRLGAGKGKGKGNKRSTKGGELVRLGGAKLTAGDLHALLG